MAEVAAESCAGMGLPVRRCESLFADVRVTLCCSNIGVAKKFLDRSKIRATIEEVGCICMP